MAVATATVVIDRVGPSAERDAMRWCIQERLPGPARGARRPSATSAPREARSAQDRFQVAMEQISRQQTAILQSVEERRELSTALDLMRERLQDAVGQRDAVAAANDRLLAQMNEVSASLTARSSGDDLTETLETVSAALAEAVAARDAPPPSAPS